MDEDTDKTINPVDFESDAENKKLNTNNEQSPNQPTNNDIVINKPTVISEKDENPPTNSMNKLNITNTKLSNQNESKRISPKTPEKVLSTETRKLPMNKIQVGSAPSPNLKQVRSKIGSMENYTHRPGGGTVKIESRKLAWKAQPKIEAKNGSYAPTGGCKKIERVKLQWNAKSKVGSLDNASHKPGGGERKIEVVKLNFKDKAKPKVGSKNNINHVPGGGTFKIEEQKLDLNVQSKVGSLDNVKHTPGGGVKKIFDDKKYLKQFNNSGTTTRDQSPAPADATNNKT